MVGDNVNNTEQLLHNLRDRREETPFVSPEPEKITSAGRHEPIAWYLTQRRSSCIEARKDQAVFFATLFELTRSESRLAALLAEGCPLPEAAERLSITHGTARNHLKQIFQKTYTNSQVELVAMLVRLVS